MRRSKRFYLLVIIMVGIMMLSCGKDKKDSALNGYEKHINNDLSDATLSINYSDNTASLLVSGIKNMSAFQVKLYYDPDTCEISNVELSDYFKKDSATNKLLGPSNNINKGIFEFGGVRISNNKTLNGSGVIANIELVKKKNDNNPLKILEAKISDNNAAIINVKY